MNYRDDGGIEGIWSHQAAQIFHQVGIIHHTRSRWAESAAQLFLVINNSIELSIPVCIAYFWWAPTSTLILFFFFSLNLLASLPPSLMKSIYNTFRLKSLTFSRDFKFHKTFWKDVTVQWWPYSLLGISKHLLDLKVLTQLSKLRWDQARSTVALNTQRKPSLWSCEFSWGQQGSPTMRNTWVPCGGGRGPQGLAHTAS